jgi:hypothetical protein
MLRVAVADAQLSGERIAYHRKRLGLSQVEFAAEKLRDPLAVAASSLRMADAFLTLGQTGQVRAVADAVTASLERRAARKPTAKILSLCGAFHLVLAIAAAWNNDRPQAHKHLGQAREIADREGAGRDNFGARNLIRLSGSRPRPELRELAERFGVLP